ncbi:MAG: hypothetical protein R3272_10220 [Candidatus Promineifilaceae bacterium]|nr:hypothetical protein [Candidatus Promineifilaceae bacterium]
MAYPSADEAPRLTTEVAKFWLPQGQWTEINYLQLADSQRIVELSKGTSSAGGWESYLAIAA